MTTPKAGFEWDALRRQWKPCDYTKMTVEQLAERRSTAAFQQDEIEAQIKGLLPASAAQALLQRSSYGLYDLLIKLAKQAPETLLGAI